MRPLASAANGWLPVRDMLFFMLYHDLHHLNGMRGTLHPLANTTPDAVWLQAQLAKFLRRGARADRLARADWARLLPQLLPLDLAATVRAAAAEHTAT